MDHTLPYDAAAISAALSHTIPADHEDHSMIYATSVDLTPTERRLFDALATGEPVSRQDLQEKALGMKYASASAVSTRINKMRPKLAGAFAIKCKAGLYSMRSVNG